MFQAAAEHAPTLHRAALAAGLSAVRSVDFSFASGPSDFYSPRVTVGGQYWRVVQFHSACDCWQVIDPNFHPNFR